MAVMSNLMLQLESSIKNLYGLAALVIQRLSGPSCALGDMF